MTEPVRALPSFAVVLVMAGRGRRFGGVVPKVHVPLGGKSLWRHSAELFAALPGCDSLVLVTAESWVDAVRDQTADLPSAVVVAGGERRQDSVRLGLAAVSEEFRLVAIHDAARPLIDRDTALAVVVAAAVHGGAIAAVSVRDTLKRVVAAGAIVETVERKNVWAAQTPQAFHRDLIVRAHAAAQADGREATDDASLVEALGVPVHVVSAPIRNLKVTTADDLAIATALLRPPSGAP